MTDGFLGRWSKRKLEVKEGKAIEAETVAPGVPPPQPSPKGGGSEQAFAKTAGSEQVLTLGADELPAGTEGKEFSASAGGAEQVISPPLWGRAGVGAARTSHRP